MEEQDIKPEETAAEEQTDKSKKIIKGVIGFISAVLIAYLGIALHYAGHFCYGSVVNGINISDKTVAEVEEQMASVLQAYTLELKERGGINEQIKAEEIGLRYSSEDVFKSFKDRQKPLQWISAYINLEKYNITAEVSYDDGLLKKRIDNLSCFDGKNIIEPKNPAFQYADSGYVIIDEVNGNKVDKDILYHHVSDAVLKRETTLDLEAIDCYVKPQYTSKSPEVTAIKNMLDKYASSKITYTFGDHKVTLDGSIINKWLIVDENCLFTFDEEGVKEYMDEFARTYNTVGKTRDFVTTSGNTIKVKGGDYGWLIDAEKETQELIAAIKEGQNIEKEPACKQKARTHGYNDIGGTYVEISITGQHLWFYKNGSLVIDGAIVSGTANTKYATPAGVYRLKYKKRNAVLVGPDYRCPVSFWMPFNGGIGIHDATWRGRFGGRIYRSNGSHGCINASYNLAKTIFNNIEAGTPVVCYY